MIHLCSPDRWNFWEAYLAAVELASAGDITDHLTFARELKDKNAADSTIRGPRLAELSLLALASNNSQIESRLVDYFVDFGDRHCFFEDTRRYFAHFSAEAVAMLLNKLEASLPTDDEKKRLHMVVNIWKVRCLKAESGKTQIKELFDLFQRSFEFGKSIFTSAQILIFASQFCQD